MSPEIIVYAYDLAPNPQKLLQFLAFFKIPYKYVEIPVTMPRPMLSEIGVTYRRSPLLSIGSDMYVDNGLIVEKLADIAAHRLEESGLDDVSNHVEYDGLGQMAWQLGTGLIPVDWPPLKDEKLISDRVDLIGRPFGPEVLKEIRPVMLSKMVGLVKLVESKFLGGEKKFFLGGRMPSTADMHLYWGLNWGLRYHLGTRPEISETTYPKIFGWMDAVEAFIKDRRVETKIEMEDAYLVLKVPPTHEYAKFVPHVEDNPEKLSPGRKIKVTPVDTGRSGPQFGELISLNYEQVCLRNEKGLVMHFPRFGYEVAAA